MAAIFNSLRTLTISITALIIYAYDSDEMCRGRITAALRTHDAKDIDISQDWLRAGVDRKTFVYDVAWTDAQGRRATNRCTVAIRPLADDGLTWERPLD